MVILVKLLAIVVMVFGVIYLLKPNIIKPYMAFWTIGKRIYMGAILSLVIGIILLLAASQCAVTWFIAAFGILGIIKGIVLFVLGPEKTISMLKWWEEKPVAFLRLHALVAIIIGALLIYSA